jgi:hypothetical protein
MNGKESFLKLNLAMQFRVSSILFSLESRHNEARQETIRRQSGGTMRQIFPCWAYI